MRRLLIGLVVTTTTALVPMLALADNQQVAEQIAANLRNSGQLHGYKIGVKFQDGTAWLRGTVTSERQLQSALRVAASTAGVQRVENQLAVGSGESAAPTPLGRLMKPLSRSAVQPASADLPVHSLQQGSGALAPEQFPRNMAVMGDTGARPVSQAPTGPALSAPEQAHRVPATFAPVPAMATNAEEPTPAPQPIPMPGTHQMQAQPMAAPAPFRAAAGRPVPIAYSQANGPTPAAHGYVRPAAGGVAPVRYDQPHMPNYAWPSYAAYPNYAAVTYPRQYSPTAWPYIGPFYPYPQVPLGWRKVSLEWHDGWWMLDFDDGAHDGPLSGLFRAR